MSESYALMICMVGMMNYGAIQEVVGSRTHSLAGYLSALAFGALAVLKG